MSQRSGAPGGRGGTWTHAALWEWWGHESVISCRSLQDAACLARHLWPPVCDGHWRALRLILIQSRLFPHKVKIKQRCQGSGWQLLVTVAAPLRRRMGSKTAVTPCVEKRAFEQRCACRCARRANAGRLRSPVVIPVSMLQRLCRLMRPAHADIGDCGGVTELQQPLTTMRGKPACRCDAVSLHCFLVARSGAVAASANGVPHFG